MHLTYRSLSKLTPLIQQRNADVTKLHVAISKDSHYHALIQREQCLAVLNIRFCHNGLALNPDKSDAIILGAA